MLSVSWKTVEDPCPTVLGSLILTVEEIQSARRILLKIAQRESFPQEVIALQKGKPVPVRSRLVTLSPFTDGDGIIRAGGRIDKADIPL
jgi:hypothetical protein